MKIAINEQYYLRKRLVMLDVNIDAVLIHLYNYGTI